MVYKSLSDCIQDLEANGHLVRISDEVDPKLEAAEIHRRFFESQGPAVLFEKVKGTSFPVVSNLYGTLERTDFIFRKTLPAVQKLFELKADPKNFLRNPFRYLSVPITALKALPLKTSKVPVMECETTIDALPQIQSWPEDGGAFILLPQVYTEDPSKPGWRDSNLGMYRIQLSGNDYEMNKEIGLHYQIRRDIGIHHLKAVQQNEPLRVSIFVGGPPSHAFSAVMYLPEHLPEVMFAGALAGRRFRFTRHNGFLISADADFCITGYVDPKATKPEGPFGDHLGYYALKHLFPYLKVEKVFHRKDAIWPMTVVGRPPQEDSSFGHLVQKLGGSIIRQEIPGIKAVHAVDAAGVHPLLLAIGSERYVPYQERKPQELLTLANAVLGYGPCSLAKYLWIGCEEDDPSLSIRDIRQFFMHILERVDWMRDLHFQTQTTIDTLDYSGTDLNEGSKLVIAACGRKRRTLSDTVPDHLELPEGFLEPRVVMPGILALKGPSFESYQVAEPEMKLFSQALEELQEKGFPLVILADDSEFVSESEQNFLWVTFTRSNPSHDVYGAQSQTKFKHWGCRGPLVIDARVKPHHAPGLSQESSVIEKVNRRLKDFPHLIREVSQNVKETV